MVRKSHAQHKAETLARNKQILDIHRVSPSRHHSTYLAKTFNLGRETVRTILWKTSKLHPLPLQENKKVV